VRELIDRVAVVTGGAQGIGRALALECARAGMHVVLADVDESGMSATAALVEKSGRRALCVPIGFYHIFLHFRIHLYGS
jgi:NAD(P)-dependent dehydrogenase (short-subunit alcohol dehydrogenase family)